MFIHYYHLQHAREILCFFIKSAGDLSAIWRPGLETLTLHTFTYQNVYTYTHENDLEYMYLKHNITPCIIFFMLISNCVEVAHCFKICQNFDDGICFTLSDFYDKLTELSNSISTFIDVFF